MVPSSFTGALELRSWILFGYSVSPLWAHPPLPNPLWEVKFKRLLCGRRRIIRGRANQSGAGSERGSGHAVNVVFLNTTVCLTSGALANLCPLEESQYRVVRAVQPSLLCREVLYLTSRTS